MTATGVLTFALITPALPDLADALGVSRGSIGLVQGAVAIPGTVLAIFMGYLADLRGRRFVGMWSLVIFGVAGVAGFFARDFWVLVAVRAVQGIGTSGLLSLGVVVVGDLFIGEQRRWALGINAAGITITAMISPILGGALAQLDPFYPFLLFGVAFPLIWWARLLPGVPDGPPPAPAFRHVRDMFRLLHRDRTLSDFVGLLPFSLVTMVVFVGFGFTVTPLFLEGAFGVEAAPRGLIQSVLSVGSSITSLAAARLRTRYQPSTILSVAMAGVVAGFIVLSWSPSLPVVGAGLFIIGLSIGVIFPVVQEFLVASVPAEFRGAAVGTWISFIRTGQVIGPILGAALADGIGERITYGVGAVVFALLAAAAWPLRRAARSAVHPPS